MIPEISTVVVHKNLNIVINLIEYSDEKFIIVRFHRQNRQTSVLANKNLMA